MINQQVTADETNDSQLHTQEKMNKKYTVFIAWETCGAIRLGVDDGVLAVIHMGRRGMPPK